MSTTTTALSGDFPALYERLLKYYNSYPFTMVFDEYIAHPNAMECEVALQVVTNTGKVFHGKRERVNNAGELKSMVFASFVRGESATITLEISCPAMPTIAGSFRSSTFVNRWVASKAYDPRLRIDVDLPDYSELREECCGSSKRYCQRCWIICQSAMKQIHFLATVLFGCLAEDVAFFFSGRKGIHAYVKGITESQFSEQLQLLRNDIPKISEGDSDGGDCNVNIVATMYQSCFVGYYRRIMNQLEEPSVGAVWQSLFLRCDKEISKTRHLLKAPLTIHPETGLACVRIPHEEIDSFLPESVLNVTCASMSQLSALKW